MSHRSAPLSFEGRLRLVQRCQQRHNGKAERYQRIMTEELLYAREYASEDERSQAIAIWNVHYNYHRPHSAAGGQPPASRLKTRATNVRPSYS